MKSKNSLLYSILSVLVTAILVPCARGQDGVTRYVDPFIGTGKSGHTFPGAIRPWGMVSVSPHNMPSTPSGYQHGAKYFYGFGHTHLSGTGCADLGAIILAASRDFVSPDPEFYKCRYSDESASPGFYRVRLDELDLLAEATATNRCGLTRLTVLREGPLNLLIDVGRSLALTGGGSISVLPDGEIVGYNTSGGFCGEANRQKVYFVARFNRPVVSYGVWCGNTISNESESNAGEDTAVGAWLRFDLPKGQSVIAKIGISYVSIRNARLNLEQELPDWGFDRVRTEARAAWERELRKIQVGGGLLGDYVRFYTALYHTLLHPNVLSDVNGEYPLMGRNGVGRYAGRERYSVFSLWDTYRTLHPLLTLVYPERQSAMIGTMVDMYKESGWLPKWELAGNETHMMVGDPAAIVIADGYVKGIRDFNAVSALEGMMKPAVHAGEKDALPARPGYPEYLRYGYIPFEQDTTKEWWVWGPASVTLEYCLADWSIGQMARALGALSVADSFVHRSTFFQNLFDTSLQFMRPKRKNGSWLAPFDPLATEGSGTWDGSGGPGYVEGNAWQYTWFVPHDVGRLIELFGGPKQFVKKLTECFDRKQFSMGNEPDIAYPYLFTYVPGEEAQTQACVREILSTQFRAGPDGLPGDDDCGAISAWFVFSALGIYPACPASTEYRLGLPLFQTASLDLDERYFAGGKFTIKKEGGGERSTLVRLDGTTLDQYRIEHASIVQGGQLVFTVK